MQNRQRYHIIVDTIENVPAVRTLLEQSSFTDIRTWKSFPLLMNVSLTTEQADWLKTQHGIAMVEQTQGVYLHENTIPTKQYEIHLDSPAALGPVRLALLKRLDITVNSYELLPQSLFTTLSADQYRTLMATLTSSTDFSNVTNVTENNQPINEFTRVQDLQRYNWGIERIAHRTINFFENIRFTRNGAGTRVFVIDTGVQSNHDELRGRVSPTYRFDAFRSVGDPLYGEPSTEVGYDGVNVITDDHGTHVASIAAGSTVGVAPGATVISVRAFSNFAPSTTENLLDAVDWVVQTHTSLGGPSVANLSLAINGKSEVGHIIVASMINVGITVVVSAGNNGTDAYLESPASAGTKRELVEVDGQYQLQTVFSPLKPIVVGASVFPRSAASSNDSIWKGSNWGDVVDVFAPGVDIYGASLQVFDEQVDLARTGSYALKTGTSMAAPVVAGIALMQLEAKPQLSHAEVRKLIIEQATPNPFAPTEVQHVRVDAPVFVDINGTQTQAKLANIYVHSPNRLAYAWFTNTRIEWADQEYQFDIDEQTRELFELRASSSDYYRDSERVDFSYVGLDVPPAYTTLGTIVFYKTLEYVTSVGNIMEQADVANFRVTAPAITGDVSGLYAILATDGRMTSARRFRLNTRNVPQPPVWITPPAGELTVVPVEKGYQFNETVVRFEAVQVDGLPVTYTITPQKALPPGLQFTLGSQTVNGVTTYFGYLNGRVGNIPYSTEPRRYEFLIRATASNGMIAERLFVLSCKYKNELHTFRPSWLSSLFDYGSGIKRLGKANIGNSYYKHIEVINTDGDALDYRVDFVPSIADAPGVYNGVLPVGLGLDDKGDIEGIIDPSAQLGQYFFRVIVTDIEDNQIFQDFLVDVINQEENLPDSDQIIWITPAGNIGNIYETFASHLGVEAKSPEGLPISYMLNPSGGILPDGMELDQETGYITGIAPFVDNTIEYTFIVRATVGARYVDREFSLTIVSQYSGASVLNFKANMMGYDRLEVFNWTDSKQIIPRNDIFRPTDPNFGTLEQPHMYVLSGTSVVKPNQIMDYLKDYHKRMYLVFGNLTWSPAHDMNGTHVYDVVYMRVHDPLIKVGGFLDNLSEETLTLKQSKPYDNTLWDEQSQLSRYFPNSVANARDDLISQVDGRQGLGLANQEGLPLWMRSRKQPSRPEIVGFTPAILVAYVKPGKGQSTVNLLTQAGFNRTFRGREFILDRYYISDIVTRTTTFFDSVDGEPTTIFDEPDLQNHPLPPDQDPNDVDGLIQQTLFDVKTVETGKYYKFEDDAPILADRLANPYR